MSDFHPSMVRDNDSRIYASIAESLPLMKNIDLHTVEINLFTDPGGTSGWAAFTQLGRVVSYGQTPGLDNFKKELTILGKSEYCPKKVFAETFRIRPKKGTRGTNRRTAYNVNERRGIEVTLRVLGVIEAVCDVFDIPYEEIEVPRKEDGYAWGGLPKVKDHKESHRFDALAHGYCYFVEQGVIKVRRRPL